MAVQVIKAQPKAKRQAAGPEPVRLKVAAYCRVSTDSEEQESSYEAQCSHYSAYIRANPEWELVGIYADEGISGTTTRHRERFRQMVADCEAGKIDLVVTKSISRFARNTLDCLQYIRRLKARGVAVYFEKENINTLDAKGEVLITIMASIAQQESASISQNVRMGIQYRMQEGKGRLNTAHFLGLAKDAETEALVAVPGEADVVRRIYREYLEGYSPAQIGRRLDADGVPTPAGGVRWYQSTVSSILENEKYCGDLLLQKYYTADFLTHRVVRNTGQLPQYYVEDAHEPVVPKAVFFQVQGEMMRRAQGVGEPCGPRRHVDDALYGRLSCGKCGRTLKRYEKPDGSADWRCRARAYKKKSDVREERGACACRVVEPGDAQRAVVEAFNLLPGRRGSLQAMKAAIREGEIAPLDERLAQVRAQRAAAGEDVAELDALRDAIAIERAVAADAEMRVRALLELVDTMAGVRVEVPVRAWCADYEEFFARTRFVPRAGLLDEDGRVARYDDDLAARFVRTVVVEDDAYEVRFKAGLHIRVKA